MHPILFHVGDFPVRSFGLMMVLAVGTGIWLAMNRAPQYGLKRDQMLDLATWLILPGILGARVVYILLNYQSEFAGHPERIFTLQFEGLTSFGGFIFGFLGGLVWAKLHKIRVPDVMDILSVPVLVGWSIGRIACLLNGCCFGRTCEGGFCVEFEHFGPRVPAQIVDMVMLALGAFVLSRLETRFRAMGAGTMAVGSVVAFALSRFVYEFFRAGTPEEVSAGLASGRYIGSLPITEAQLGSLAMIAVGVGWLIWRQRSLKANHHAEVSS